MTQTKAVFFLVSTLICGMVFGEQPVLVITPTGFFFLETGKDGIPISVSVEKIVDLRDGSQGPSSEPEAPQPDSALSVEVRELAKAAADPSGAQALALVYTQSSEAVAGGLIPVTSALEAVRKASDNALGLTGSATKWDLFRVAISTIATERTQKGELATAQQMGDFLRAVAIGLELAADGSEALDFSVVIGIATGTNKAFDEARK